MTKKNTLSILESIKKKLNKFDEPKATKAGEKNFSDLGDEFEYIDNSGDEEDAPIAVNDQQKQEPTKVEHDIILENQIKNSFSEEEFLEEEPIKKAFVEPVEEKQEEEIKEEEEDTLDLDSFEEESEFEEMKAHKSLLADHEEDEGHLEDDEMFADLDLEEDEHEESVVMPENKLSSAVLEKEDEDIFEEVEEYSDEDAEENLTQQKLAEKNLFGDESEDNLNSPLEENYTEETLPNFVAKTTSQAPEQSQIEQEPESDENDLDKLLAENDQKYLSTEKPQEEHLEDWANEHSAPVLANKIDSEKAEQNNAQIDAATKSFLKQDSIQKASDSMKKLFDAKNVVSSVNSFTKSDNMSEIAIQLLESRMDRWLNENLPALVEKIVQEEIKKIIPKE